MVHEWAQDWFALRRPEPDVITIVEPIVMSYLVVGQERAILIDTGMGVGDMRALVTSLTDKPVTVVNSHAHWDHIGGDRLFEEIVIHGAEAADLERGVPQVAAARYLAPEQLGRPMPVGFDLASVEFPPVRPTRLLRGGETLDLGGRTMDVIHAPGHSPGSIVLLDPDNGVLFSTDVAYPGDLYCQFEESDLDAYRRTLAHLAELAPTLRTVYPSHDGSPMDPALLPRMRDALGAIAAGRAAEEFRGDVAIHTFDGFGVRVPGDRPGKVEPQ